MFSMWGCGQCDKRICDGFDLIWHHPMAHKMLQFEFGCALSV